MNDLGGEIAAVLLFSLIFGGLLALVVLALRREAPGVRGLAAWYVQSAIGLTAALTLGGIAELITAIIGYIHQSSAYVGGGPGGGAIYGLFSGSGGVTTAQARELDLIYGVVMIIVGGLVVWLHMMLAKRAGLPILGSLGWAWWSSPAITLVVFGLVGVVSLLGLINTVITNVVASVDQPWASDLALAVVFLPAWALMATRLFDVVAGALAPAAEPGLPVQTA